MSDTNNGELFAAQQMAQPPSYTGAPRTVPNRGAIFYDSGTWQVPVGAQTVYVSATGRGRHLSVTRGINPRSASSPQPTPLTP